MSALNPKFKDIDDYIKSFPPQVQEILQKIRHIIQEESPEATEIISYDMAAFKLNGRNLIHFAGFKNHVSIFSNSAREVLEQFGEEIKPYFSGQGTLKFMLDKPIPYDLIKK